MNDSGRKAAGTSVWTLKAHKNLYRDVTFSDVGRNYLTVERLITASDASRGIGLLCLRGRGPRGVGTPAPSYL